MSYQPAITEAEREAEQPYDTSDPATVNTARKKAARLDRTRLDVVAGLMDLKEGRAWVYGMLEASHIWQPSFAPGDPHMTSFRDGERNNGLRLLADIMAAAPKQYVVMCEEAKP